MVVARYSHGQLIIVDRLREMVRLAAGLDEHDRLRPRVSDARARRVSSDSASGCATCSADSVRVVGTNTLRKARRKGAFLERAREALGHPIEIISGVEEARLIYLGVAHTTPSDAGRRLVVDIGGGSTELIVGEGLATKRLDSLYMGCVSLTVEHFPDGTISEKRMKRARTAAQLELEPVAARFRQVRLGRGVRCVGDDARGVGDRGRARRAERRHRPPGDRVADRGVPSRRRRVAAELPGLAADRAEIFPAGAAILVEVFDLLGIESMRVADGALREGLLYDLLGRLTDEDARARSVRAMEARYHVDTAQADRVEADGVAFLAAGARGLGSAGAARGAAPALGGAAARGRSRHLALALPPPRRLPAASTPTCPGFRARNSSCSRHSSAVTGASSTARRTRGAVPPWHLKAEFLIVLLRLAVLLHRGRGPRSLPEIALRAKGGSLEIGFPKGWLADQPLTEADLEQEIRICRQPGSGCEYRARPALSGSGAAVPAGERCSSLVCAAIGSRLPGCSRT